MKSEAIRVENINFSYPRGSFKLEIEQFILYSNELCLVTGENGSGKSTLLKLCQGIEKCEDSKLFHFNTDVSESSLGKIGKRVGYLFQEPSRQLFCATVWDEMTFVGAMNNEVHEVIVDKAVRLLKQFSLNKLARRSVYKLSRGEKQRLAIATILMNDIVYLILDEPTTGLDKENRRVLYDMIDALLQQGIGIAMITHDQEVLKRYKDSRKVVLDKGKIIV